MEIQNFDEVEFSDVDSGFPAFMNVGRTQNGHVSIALTVIGVGDFGLVVTAADARRLGERLVVVTNEISSDK
jgi:hypothetical protein